VYFLRLLFLVEQSLALVPLLLVAARLSKVAWLIKHRSLKHQAWHQFIMVGMVAQETGPESLRHLEQRDMLDIQF
jgi:hypothetical protein